MEFIKKEILGIGIISIEILLISLFVMIAIKIVKHLEKTQINTESEIENKTF